MELSPKDILRNIRKLTAEEVAILEMVFEAKTYEVVGDSLGYEMDTVRKKMGKIYDKLEIYEKDRGEKRMNLIKIYYPYFDKSIPEKDHDKNAGDELNFESSEALVSETEKETDSIHEEKNRLKNNEDKDDALKKFYGRPQF